MYRWLGVHYRADAVARAASKLLPWLSINLHTLAGLFRRLFSRSPFSGTCKIGDQGVSVDQVERRRAFTSMVLPTLMKRCGNDTVDRVRGFPYSCIPVPPGRARPAWRPSRICTAWSASELIRPRSNSLAPGGRNRPRAWRGSLGLRLPAPDFSLSPSRRAIS